MLSLVPCLGLLSSEIVGLPCREDRSTPGVTELDVDAAPQHKSAASAIASKFFPNLGSEVRHLHLQTLLQLQGFRREVTTRLVRRTEEHEHKIQSPRCLLSASMELGILDACRTSFSPFGSAGVMGMNRLAEEEDAA